MKMQAKFYKGVNKTPIEVQNTTHGKIEVYSLNDYQFLYDANVPKGRFTTWTCDGKGPFKLLIEDSYKEEMGKLYTESVNEVWLSFYKDLDTAKKKAYLQILLPVSIALLGLVALVQYVLPIDDSIKLYIVIAIVIGFFFFNKIINSRINTQVDGYREKTREAIRKIVGGKVFDDLMDSQDDWKKEFFKKKYVEQYGEDYDDDHTPTESYNEPGSDADSSDADAE